MNRLKLLLAMALLASVLAAAVYLGSPYAPVVAPCPEDIEAIWAIEDAREESETPLVTALENHGTPLAYDAGENTFYCTLGLQAGEAWPALHLTAPGAKGVHLMMADDYSYDFCADALRDGYAYQLLTYTDTQFAYAQIVFTGLPIIQLAAGQPIPAHEDVPVEVTLSEAGAAPLRAPGRAHKRGATSLNKTPKNGVKVEFTRGPGGGKTTANVPFFGATQELTLIACSIDPLMIRDKLSWDLYSRMMEDGAPFGQMRTRYAELFVDGDYQGVYLMMDPFDYAKEMARADADAPTRDTYYRLVDAVVENPLRPTAYDGRGHSYEQHYAHAGETDFQSIRPYLDLMTEEDDAAFSRKALRLLDLDSVIRYVLFTHACGMTDNEWNNLNIWAHAGPGGVHYRFVPWDLDVSWGVDDERNAEIWYSFELFDRLVRLDCGGVVRAKVRQIWRDMRAHGFDGDTVAQLLDTYSAELNDTGAFYRNTVRWARSADRLETYEVYAYAEARFAVMDQRIEALCDEALRDRQLQIGPYETLDVGALDDNLRGME